MEERPLSKEKAGSSSLPDSTKPLELTFDGKENCVDCGWIDFRRQLCMWHRRHQFSKLKRCRHFTSHTKLVRRYPNTHISRFIMDQDDYHHGTAP